MAKYIGYRRTPAEEAKAVRLGTELLARLLRRPVERIGRAVKRRTPVEIAAALALPEKRAPAWARRLRAISEAAPAGDEAVLAAAWATTGALKPRRRKASGTRNRPG